MLTVRLPRRCVVPGEVREAGGVASRRGAHWSVPSWREPGRRGGAFPRHARTDGVAEPFGAATTGRPCRFEVVPDAAHPSQVVPPVLR
jgi:hypothetical protein